LNAFQVEIGGLHGRSARRKIEEDLARQKPEPPDQAAEIVTGGSEDGAARDRPEGTRNSLIRDVMPRFLAGDETLYSIG
jgi:hypothetical protein